MAKSRRWTWKTIFLEAALMLVLVAGLPLALAWKRIGSAPSAADQRGFASSPQWEKDEFANRTPAAPVPMAAAFRRFLFEASDVSEPTGVLPIATPPNDAFVDPPSSGLRVTWLGHSTLFLEIDSKRILIDPVWCERASPFWFAGARRFHPPPVPLGHLLPLDAVIISHDHYDHLDMETVRELLTHDISWVVPLGVGSHLRYWGEDDENIAELDWWETYEVGEVTITATPSRHSSGRDIYFTDMNATLWAGWALNGPEHAVFYSGDTSMHEGFVEIGERLGPFDLSIIETGAYDPLWADSHLGPEQAVIAHELVRAKLLLPVHWATFNLAAHGWTEPAERVVAAALMSGVPIALPRPGESFEPAIGYPSEPRWPDEAWESASERPMWSTEVDQLLEGRR